MKARGWVMIMALSACTSESEPSTLGMNDVSILLPLPYAATTATLVHMTGDGAGDLVPRDLFAGLEGSTIAIPYEDFQIVAVRFDLCDRATPGPCADGEDGRLRVVYQPIDPVTANADDVALHAFYAIPAADLPDVVESLRALAKLQNVPPNSPLNVNAASADYLAQLRSLVLRYAVPSGLVRLTLFALDSPTVVEWMFRGVELVAGSFQPIAVVGTGAALQEVQLGVGKMPDVAFQPSYFIGTMIGVAQSPPGPDASSYDVALSADAFAAASAPSQMLSLEALAAAQNPLLTVPATEQCVACHTSTVLTRDRATLAAVDPTTIQSTFTSPGRDLTTIGQSITDASSLRAFGWLDTDPEISQRVVNDTAEVLDEIAARFP